MGFGIASIRHRVLNRTLLNVLVSIIGAWAAYESAQYVLANDFTGLAYAAILIAGGAAALSIFNNWRNGVYLLFGWLMFEDFVRKFLGNNMAIYFGKDCLALLVYISFLGAIKRRETSGFRPPFLMPLLILLWFGLLQLFNPGSTSIWYGLLGVKLYFYYVPLLFVGYALIDSEAQLVRFFTLNVVLIIVVISLGAAQAVIGPSFLNPTHMAAELELLSHTYRVASDGSLAYRPTSVFVSAGRFIDFVDVAWLLVLGFGGYLLLRLRRRRILVFVAMVVTAAGVVFATSRGAFMWALINTTVTTIAFLWGAPWKQQEGLRVFRSIQRVALAIGIAIALSIFAYPDAFFSRLAIYGESLLPGSPTSELAHRTWDYPIRNFLGAFDDRWPYGYGIGTSSLGGQYVARFFNTKPIQAGVESGFGTLVVEMGVGGLLLWIVMSSAIVLSAWTIVKKLKGSPLFPLAFVIFWYAIFLLFASTYAGIQTYEDFLLNAYLWLLLGVLFRLPTLSLPPELISPKDPRKL